MAQHHQSVLEREDLWDVVSPAQLSDDSFETIDPSQNHDSKGKEQVVAFSTPRSEPFDKDKLRRRKTKAMDLLHLFITDMVKPYISQILDPAEA